MQPEELYELDTDPTPEAEGAALLVHLEGFMDAGAAGRLVTEHLLDTFEHTVAPRTKQAFEVVKARYSNAGRPSWT